MFRDANGKVWHWRGMSAFLLFYRFAYLHEDIDPVLNQYVLRLGANVLRVFFALGWDDLSPRFFPDNLLDFPGWVDKFFDKLASHGVRCEATFGDMQIVFPSQAGEHDDHRNARLNQFYAGFKAQLDAHWNTFSETCNEPFKNGVDVTAVVPPVGPALRASGNYDLPDATVGAPGPNMRLFHLDYVTTHGERKDEWPRTGKDLQELREGWPGGVNAEGKAYRGLDACDCPVVADEGMGADETNQPGKRSNVPADFGHFAAGCALMGAGATFHSSDGIQAVLLRPMQFACADNFFGAFAFVPPAAQLSPYQRGSANGGAGVGDMPMEHTDALALRTFCKGVDGAEYCVAIRPAPGWKAEARNGWRVVAEPSRGLVKLER